MPVALVCRLTGTKANVAVALFVKASPVFVLDRFLGDAIGAVTRTASDRYARNKIVNDACIRNMREKANMDIAVDTASMKNAWVFFTRGHRKTGRDRRNNLRTSLQGRFNHKSQSLLASRAEYSSNFLNWLLKWPGSRTRISLNIVVCRALVAHPVVDVCFADSHSQLGRQLELPSRTRRGFSAVSIRPSRSITR